MRVFLTTIGAAALIAAFASPAAAQMCTGDANGMCGANPPEVNSEAQSDAPMSGGPDRARDGTMSLMVAGADATFARHEPLLRHLASRLFRVGTRPGDGARTKLVNNLLAAVNLAGAAEALALAERLGLDAAATLAVIEQSSGQSWIGSDRLHRALAGDTVVKARIALLAKDSALALAMARGLPGNGPKLAMGRAAGKAFASAVRDGLADEDDANLGRWMAQPGPR